MSLVMKYAVIQTGGKQYKIAEGDVIGVDRLDVDGKKDVVFGDVLLFVSEGDVKVGTPFVSGVSVKATVLEEKKGDKIRVAKYKAKVRYRKVIGYRHTYSMVKIEQIAAGTTKKEAKEAPSVVKSSEKTRTKPAGKKP